MDYVEDGSLRNLLKQNNFYSWYNILDILNNIISGLDAIHESKLVHCDLHDGNILVHEIEYISDLGLCKPIDYFKNKANNDIYGVLPYVAPEVLHGKDYTMASDIYSFGIVAYELITGLPPYHDVPHGNDLAFNICQGLRPKIPSYVPKLLTKLIVECWDAQPEKRPTSKKLFTIVNKWQISKVYKKFNTPATPLSYKLHSGAIYTSRLLGTFNLPLPVNAPDFEKQFKKLGSKDIFKGNNYYFVLKFVS